MNLTIDDTDCQTDEFRPRVGRPNSGRIGTRQPCPSCKKITQATAHGGTCRKCSDRRWQEGEIKEANIARYIAILESGRRIFEEGEYSPVQPETWKRRERIYSVAIDQGNALLAVADPSCTRDDMADLHQGQGVGKPDF